MSAGNSVVKAAEISIGKSARRRWLPWLVVICLLGAASGAVAWYRFIELEKDEYHIILAGNIDVRQVNLAFKVDGRIATLAVDEGDAVSAGQVLATLDNRYFEDDLRLMRARRDNATAALARLEHGSRPEEIAEARAQVAQQQATLARARLDFERAERLVDKGAVSRETFDQAKSALGEADAKVKYAEEVAAAV